MWRYYGRLARRVPRLLWDSTDRYFKGLAALVFVLTLFNRPLGEWFVSAWEGVSPLWALIPVGLLFLYGLMKANYEAFQTVEAERDELQAQRRTEEQRAAIATGLQQLYRQGLALRVEVMNSTDETSASECQEELRAWRQSVIDYLVENATAGKAQYVDGVTGVLAVSRTGMKSDATRNEKVGIVSHKEERLSRLAEVLKEY